MYLRPIANQDVEWIHKYKDIVINKIDIDLADFWGYFNRILDGIFDDA